MEAIHSEIGLVVVILLSCYQAETNWGPASRCPKTLYLILYLDDAVMMTSTRADLDLYQEQGTKTSKVQMHGKTKHFEKRHGHIGRT